MPDDQTIPPALTPEQWAEWQATGKMDTPFVLMRGEDLVVDAYLDAPERHIVGALCLYGQPFGFTPEDVRAVNDCVETFGESPHQLDRALCDRLESLAARIAALLPPSP